MTPPNTSSESSAQVSGFDVNESFENDRKNLKKHVNYAHKHRIAISLRDFLSDTEKVPQKELGNELNFVWTNNPHQYPILLRAALRKIGFRGKELEAKVKEIAAHEIQHFALIAGDRKLRPKLGISFYKTRGLPFAEIRTWKAGITYDKNKATFSQVLDVITNVDQLSPEDKQDLRAALTRVKEELRERPPEPETEAFIAELEKKYELV